MKPAYYDIDITHHRRDPIDYSFSQRSHIWLIDLDDVPRLPRGLGRLCHFSSVDHAERTARKDHGRQSLRQLMDRWLAEQGVAAPNTILMLANPRIFGYVFNPLSVFYCLQATGAITHVVAEVRNTYGGRHCYLLVPDSNGDAETNKEFYVSPFYPVDGLYRMRLPRPGDDLLVSVSLQRCTDRPFSAVMTGTRRGDTATLWTALRDPLTTRAVMFGIKRHGITLYRKGLRPFSRSRREEARV